MKERLDLILFERGICPTRAQARSLIMLGHVTVNDEVVTKAGTQVSNLAKIELKKTNPYVSRGGLKLAGAIEAFAIDFKDKVVLDIGASTGGFTDCALQKGASKVYAVDVGTNQLAWSLRNNSKVKSMEQTNIKELTLEMLDNTKADIITTDLSFINSSGLFCYFEKFLKDDGLLLILIKPQFEVRKAVVPRGGVIKDLKMHEKVILSVLEKAKERNFYLKGLDISTIKGAKGNIEYFGLFSFNGPDLVVNIPDILNKAKVISEGAAQC